MPPEKRASAFATLIELLTPQGLLPITLRFEPASAKRVMF